MLCIKRMPGGSLGIFLLLGAMSLMNVAQAQQRPAKAAQSNKVLRRAAQLVGPGAGAPDKVILRINGEEVKESKLDAMVDRMMAMHAQSMMREGNQPTTTTAENRLEMKRMARQQLIDRTLFNQAIKNEVGKVTDAAVKTEMDRIDKELVKNGKSLKEMIAHAGMPEDKVKEQFKQQLAAQAVIEKNAGPVQVKEDAVKAAYEQDRERMEKVRASHILVAFNKDPHNPEAKPPTPEAKAALKKKAEGVLQKVKVGGDFAKLAKENSDCPSKEKGGDLDFFSKGMMDPKFEEAAWKLKKDEVSGVVESSFGYHIIKVTDRKPAPKYEDAQGQIREMLREQALESKAPVAVAKLRDEAKIEDLESSGTQKKAQ